MCHYFSRAGWKKLHQVDAAGLGQVEMISDIAYQRPHGGRKTEVGIKLTCHQKDFQVCIGQFKVAFSGQLPGGKFRPGRQLVEIVGRNTFDHERLIVAETNQAQQASEEVVDHDVERHGG